MPLVINVISNNGNIGPKKSETLMKTYERESMPIQEKYFLNIDVNPTNLVVKLEPKNGDNQLKEYEINDTISLIKSLLDSIFIEQINQIQIQYENFETVADNKFINKEKYIKVNKNIQGVGKKIKYADENFEVDVTLEPSYVTNLQHNQYSQYNLISRKHNFSSNELEELLLESLNTIKTLESNLKEL